MIEFSLHFSRFGDGLGIAMHFLADGRVLCFAWNYRVERFMEFYRSVESAIQIGSKYLEHGFTMEQVA